MKKCAGYSVGATRDQVFYTYQAMVYANLDKPLSSVEEFPEPILAPSPLRFDPVGIID